MHKPNRCWQPYDDDRTKGSKDTVPRWKGRAHVVALNCSDFRSVCGWRRNGGRNSGRGMTVGTACSKVKPHCNRADPLPSYCTSARKMPAVSFRTPPVVSGASRHTKQNVICSNAELCEHNKQVVVVLLENKEKIKEKKRKQRLSWT